MTLSVPGDICRALAPNRTKGFHWSTHYDARAGYRDRARLLWRQAGERRFEGKVRLTFTVFRGRILDPDGALAAMKPLIDGLKGEAFTDDGYRHVEYGPVRFVTGKAWAGPMSVTEVRIEGLDGG